MKLKLNDQGFAEVKDGKPVYVDDSGQEIAFDAPAAMAKITELNGESKQHRLQARELKEKMAAFEGIDDPAAAIKALQFAQSMEGKKVMDDDAIQKLIAAAVKPLQEKLAATESTLAEKDGHIYKLEVSNRFASSQFIKEKLVLPPDIAEATFGKAFKIEGGRVVAYDNAGNQIFSKVKPGEPADFDEAFAALIDAYPAKDAILKASGAGGSGAHQSNGKGTGTDLSKMSPTDRITAARAAGKTT